MVPIKKLSRDGRWPKVIKHKQHSSNCTLLLLNCDKNKIMHKISVSLNHSLCVSEAAFDCHFLFGKAKDYQLIFFAYSHPNLLSCFQEKTDSKTFTRNTFTNGKNRGNPMCWLTWANFCILNQRTSSIYNAHLVQKLDFKRKWRITPEKIQSWTQNQKKPILALLDA